MKSMKYIFPSHHLTSHFTDQKRGHILEALTVSYSDLVFCSTAALIWDCPYQALYFRQTLHVYFNSLDIFLITSLTCLTTTYLPPSFQFWKHGQINSATFPGNGILNYSPSVHSSSLSFPKYHSPFCVIFPISL